MTHFGLHALRCLATGHYFQRIEDGSAVWTEERAGARWSSYSAILGQRTQLTKRGVSTRIVRIAE